MLSVKRCVLAAAFAAAVGSTASATVYGDATGDVFEGPPAFFDITSVEVTNDAFNLYLTINLAQGLDPNDGGQNWGKYGVLFDTADGGSGTTGWTRNVSTPEVNDFWIGSWVDGGGGAQLWAFEGGAWNQTASAGEPALGFDMSGVGSGVVRFTVSLAALGLQIGDTFLFDVLTTGNNDSHGGFDHLSRGDQATPGWNDPSTPGAYLSYTVVPAPGVASLAAVGLAGWAGRRRR